MRLRPDSDASNYNYFRDYDPAIGRYVESDPIGLKGGSNTYGYAGQTPLAHSDFSGLDYWIEGAVEGEGGFGFHQSVCVGQYASPNGRRCISFGVEDMRTCKATKCKGKVFEDTSAAGPIQFGRYHHTTPDQDKKIGELFDQLSGREANYDLVNNNCRDFSYRLFRSLEYRFPEK